MEVDLGELLIDFLELYGRRFDYRRFGVDVRAQGSRGCMVDQRDTRNWLHNYPGPSEVNTPNCTSELAPRGAEPCVGSLTLLPSTPPSKIPERSPAPPCSNSAAAPPQQVDAARARPREPSQRPRRAHLAAAGGGGVLRGHRGGSTRRGGGHARGRAHGAAARQLPAAGERAAAQRGRRAAAGDALQASTLSSLVGVH